MQSLADNRQNHQTTCMVESRHVNDISATCCHGCRLMDPCLSGAIKTPAKLVSFQFRLLNDRSGTGENPLMTSSAQRPLGRLRAVIGRY